MCASHPTIGTVGLTEAEAHEKYGDAVKIYKSKFRALYFSMLEEEEKEPTMYKLICVGEEEKVVGIHIIGMGSDEVMQGFGVAVTMGGMCFFITCLLSRSYVFTQRGRRTWITASRFIPRLPKNW